MEQIIEEIKHTVHWHPLMLKANNALVSMGTFQHPYKGLAGITYGEWQLEKARRVVLAVLGYLSEEIIDAD